jgi:hypothetical protein
MTLVQLAPQTLSRAAPITTTGTISAKPGDPPDKNPGVSPADRIRAYFHMSSASCCRGCWWRILMHSGSVGGSHPRKLWGSRKRLLQSSCLPYLSSAQPCILRCNATCSQSVQWCHPALVKRTDRPDQLAPLLVDKVYGVRWQRR